MNAFASPLAPLFLLGLAVVALVWLLPRTVIAIVLLLNAVGSLLFSYARLMLASIEQGQQPSWGVT